MSGLLKSADSAPATIAREALALVERELATNRCVLLTGLFEVGKSTLAKAVAARHEGMATLFDLRKPTDRDRFSHFISEDRDPKGLCVLDEIQYMPDALDHLREILDVSSGQNESPGRFLILGAPAQETRRLSASRLGTRARVVLLPPVQPLEYLTHHASAPRDQHVSNIEATEDVTSRGTKQDALNKLWLRGGLPLSLAAHTDDKSYLWREGYLQTQCDRDLYGGKFTATTVDRCLRRLALHHGQLLNHTTIPNEQRQCVEFLEEAGIVRLLPPWAGNERKRFEKSPRVYIRDVGLLHALLNLRTFEEVRASSVKGHSWEGLCIESLILAAGGGAHAYFYRADDNEEIDLVLDFGVGCCWAIECKAGDGPVKSGFDRASGDVGASEKIVVRGSSESVHETERFTLMPLAEAVQAVVRRRIARSVTSAGC